MKNMILSFFIIQIISIFYSIKFKKSIGKTFILSILSIIFVLYIFGLFSILDFGVSFIKIVSFILLVYEIIFIFKNKRFAKDNIINSDNLIFILIFILLFYIHNGRMLVNWDEFSHWGDVVKAMFTINDFSTSPKSFSQFQSYPPAMSLFQYFWMKTGNIFIEYQLFVSYHLMFACLFLSFISDFKNILKKVISSLILVLMPLVMFNHFYISIYIDCILGIFFGYCILIIMLNKKYDSYFLINLLLSFFTLVLLKDVGLFLCIISLLILFADIIFIKKKIKLNKIYVNKYKKYLIILLSAVIMILFAKISWNYSIELNNAKIIFGTKISIKEFFTLLKFNNLGYREVVIKNYLDALHNKYIIYGIVNFTVITLTILLIIIIYIMNKKEPLIKKYSYYIFGGLLIYIFGLLYIYCTKFSEYEAVMLASYERYLLIYFVGILFIITILFLKLFDNLYFIILFLFIFFLFIPRGTFNDINESVINSRLNRFFYDTLGNKIKSAVNEDDKIYFISQKSTGFDYWVFKYTLRPNVINGNFTWSIGEKYYEDDLWTLEINSDEWLNILIKDNYDYVYFYDVDIKFIEQFAVLFEDSSLISNYSLFKFDKNTKKLIFVQ